MRRTELAPSILAALIAIGTSGAPQAAFAEPLTPEERTIRCEQIRDVAAENGISAGFLFAGIANAETSLSHCWSELTWACEGPESVDCGGPVVAGAGDGPCSLQQGGLGMFQFDGGTFEQTIERDGDGVLLLDGNVTRAVDFVVNMVIGSQYVEGVETAADAKAWMNQVTVDGPLWDAWIKTVTHYYNGCTPGGCSVYAQRYQHYSDNGSDVFYEQEAGFWELTLPPCANVPADGRMLEETDTCFTKGGPLSYWRVGIGGENNLHVWTSTTAQPEAVNFADWQLFFDEPGDYLLEVSLVAGSSKTASYTIDHAGKTDIVTVDQSTANGFVPLGTFDFDGGDFDGGEMQGVFLGDNTGEADGERLVADALRLTRVGGDPVGPGGGGAGAAAATGGSSAGGSAEGGAGGGPNDPDDGCSATAAGPKGSRAWLLLLVMLGFARRRRG